MKTTIRWPQFHMFARLSNRISWSVLPNKRLKLAGTLVLKEAVVSCPGGHGASSTTLAPAGESPAA